MVASTCEHTQLTLADCGQEGRGLVASTRVRKGQTLVQVPASMVITAQASQGREVEKGKCLY